MLQVCCAVFKVRTAAAMSLVYAAVQNGNPRYGFSGLKKRKAGARFLAPCFPALPTDVPLWLRSGFSWERALDLYACNSARVPSTTDAGFFLTPCSHSPGLAALIHDMAVMKHFRAGTAQWAAQINFSVQQLGKAR